MKKCFTILLILIVTGARAQDTTAHKARYAPYERYSVVVGASIGFIDQYRHNYPLAAGFEKSNTSGFAPVNFKIDYGLSKCVSLAAAFYYDAFLYNVKQVYAGNNGPFTRYIANNTRIISGGLIASYHLGKVIHVRSLDPFVGVGFAINNVRYGAYPQGDSTLTRIEHTVTPSVKVGASYYITPIFSIYGDAGYDQHTIFDIGFSCRFFRKEHK